VGAFSDDEIGALIHCPKEVSDPPRREMRSTGADHRNDMKLTSDECQGAFSVFLRRNIDFPENFSVGLIYHPNDGREALILMRCNGPHGECNGHFDASHPHWSYHVHKATEEAIESGLRPERKAEQVDAYGSFEEAIQYFVKEINLKKSDADKYFPGDSLQRILNF
jgi:hypothetical protein